MVFLIYIGTTLTKRLQLDFTEEKLYTLSSGSKAILKKLNTPMKLKFYYSKTAANKGTEGIRAFNNYFFYVRDILNEYVANSGNKLSLEIIDPRPDTKDEEEAITYGLKKFNLTETERYFFGLVIKTESGAEKIIEFFNPNQQENLEYDITKLIYTVTNPQKKKVGILSSLNVLADDMNPYMAQIMRMQGKNPQRSWIITQMMKEFFEVKKINIDSQKISGIDILFIIHPKNFPDKILFAIDQFVLNGGNVVLLE